LKALGVDPGMTNTGYGLVISVSGGLEAGEFGTIHTLASDDMSHRLDTLYTGMKEVIARLEPDVVVLEQLFFNTNQKTALVVSQARGVLLLACRHAGVQWYEYTPLQVKMAVTGSGNAAKTQVKYMVKALLRFDTAPASLHECDALAMAICHLNSRRIREKTGTRRHSPGRG